MHQFCKIGSLAMIGGMSAVENDVIPYSLAIGNRAKITGVNIIGLKELILPRVKSESIHKLLKKYLLVKQYPKKLINL